MKSDKLLYITGVGYRTVMPISGQIIYIYRLVDILGILITHWYIAFEYYCD